MLAFKVTLAFVVLNISCLFTFIHSATPPAQVDFLSSLTTLPPRAGHRAFLVKNDTELVVFGGTSSTDPNQATIHINLPSSSNQSIEPRAFRYSDSASRRKSLYGFSAVAVNETHILCIFGSDPSSTDLGGLYVLWYDLLSEEWTDLATMGDTPLARFNQHDVVVDNGNVTTLFVYGGTSRVNGSTLADLVALSIPGSHSPNFFWTGYNFPPKAQNNPGKRSGHSMAAYGNYVFICFGLLDQNFVTNECSVLDTNSLKFVKATFKGEKPNPRIGATLSVQGSTIILFGGIDPTTSPPAEYNDLWTLNISNLDDLNWKKQSPTGSVPSPRYHHTSIIWNSDYMIVYGGKRNSGWAEDVIHSLDIRKLEWSAGVLNPYAASSTSTDTSPSPNPNNIVDHPGYLLVLMFVCGGIGLTGALVLLIALLKRDRTVDPKPTKNQYFDASSELNNSCSSSQTCQMIGPNECPVPNEIVDVGGLTENNSNISLPHEPTNDQLPRKRTVIPSMQSIQWVPFISDSIEREQDPNDNDPSIDTPKQLKIRNASSMEFRFSTDSLERYTHDCDETVLKDNLNHPSTTSLPSSSSHPDIISPIMESLEHYNKDTNNNLHQNHPNPYPYTIENLTHSTQPTPTPQSNHTPPKSSPFIPPPSTSQPFIPSRPQPTAPSHPQIQFHIPLPPTSDVPRSRESFVTTSSSVGGIKDSAESVGKCSVENSFLRSHDFQDSVDSGSYIEQDSENDFDIDSEHYGDGSINNME